jgi:hypothetical protein
MTRSRYTYPGCGRIPPVQMEDVPLGEGDVLLHLREGDEPYMLITQDGSWEHVVACVLAYVMQRQDMFDICLQSWLGEMLKQPDRWEMFKKTLAQRGLGNSYGIKPATPSKQSHNNERKIR